MVHQMKLIIEDIEDAKYITEEKDGVKSLYIEGTFLQGGIKNRNGRIYPVETLSREVNRYVTESVLKNRAYGELNHPNGPSINLDRVSHRIVELKQNGSTGNFYGKALIMNTPMGNIARGIIESGGSLGVSSRGLGTLKETNGGKEVQDDFFLACGADIVADPSAPDAFVQGILESVNWFWDNGSIKATPAAELAKKEIEELYMSKENREEKILKVFENYLKTF